MLLFWCALTAGSGCHLSSFDVSRFGVWQHKQLLLVGIGMLCICVGDLSEGLICYGEIEFEIES